MAKSTRQFDRHVESVLAALSVLDCFLDAPALTLKQLIEKTGFTRNRVMRLTGTLVHRHYLMADSAAGAFTPGPKLMSLAGAFESNRNLVSLARPMLQALSLKTGESVSLYGRSGLERIVLAREEGTHEIRFAVSEGQRMDLFTGASGKILLAYAPPAVLASLINGSGPLESTDKRLGDARKLEDEIDRVRRQGYAVSKGERIADAYAIAVPVFGPGQTLLAALGIAGPVSRFTQGARRTYLQALRDAADALSRLMGWRPGGSEDPPL